MLETSLEAVPEGGVVGFTLRVENRGDEEAELSFSDSQRVRISVYSGDVAGEDADDADDAEPIWRSDEGQMFMQMLGSEPVPAGEGIEFQEEWGEPEAGEYLAVGEVLCRDRELQDETTFAV